MEKIKVYVVCLEEDAQGGIISEAWPFRTLEEAWERAKIENKQFVDDYGEDAETEVKENVSIYTYTCDYYIYITVTEYEI